jgi:hypothetical protein
MKLFNVISNFLDAYSDVMYHFEQDENGKVIMFKTNPQDKDNNNDTNYSDFYYDPNKFEEQFSKMWNDFKLERTIIEYFKQSGSETKNKQLDQISENTGSSLPLLLKTTVDSARRLVLIVNKINENTNKIITNLQKIKYPGIEFIPLIKLLSQDEISSFSTNLSQNIDSTKLNYLEMKALNDLSKSSFFVIICEDLEEKLNFLFNFVNSFNQDYLNSTLSEESKTDLVINDSEFVNSFNQDYLNSLNANLLFQDEYDKELDELLETIRDPIIKEQVKI